MHAHLNGLAAVVFADGEKFHHIPEFVAVGDVLPRDLGDALAVHRFERHLGVEGKARQDGKFIRRVVALDVGGGVRLRIAERLRVFEHRAIIGAFARHAGQDVVGGTVDDAGQRRDDVCLQPVDEGADDGNAAHATCLKVQPRVGAARRRFQFVPVLAEQFFVGRDDGLAAVQCRQNETARRFDAADHLDDDIDVGIADDFGNIVGNAAFLDAQIERFLAVDLQHALDGDVDVLGTAIKFPVIAQNFVRSASDHPESEDGNADTFHFLTSVFRS